MKMAALGWYGHKNEGDERIGECLKKYVESREHTLDLIDPFTKDFFKVNEYDFVLYGGGGLIHRGFNKCTYILDQIRVPMGFVGISVEACDETNNLFIEKMLDKAEFVYVRDKRSAKALNYHPKVIQSEDLSFLYPWDIVENPMANEDYVLNLRNWQYWKIPYASPLDKRLRALARKRPRFYRLLRDMTFWGKVYDPKSIVALLKERQPDLKSLSFYDDNPPIHTVYPLTGNDQDILRLSGLSVQDFTVDQIKTARLVYAMRLHCVIYCIQMGVPCLSLNYEPKNQGLLQNLGLPGIGLSVFDVNRQTLDEKEKYIMDNYQEIREKFLSYREYAHRDVHATMDQIFSLIDSKRRGLNL